jgi:hypothetical protein
VANDQQEQPTHAGATTRVRSTVTVVPTSRLGVRRNPPLPVDLAQDTAASSPLGATVTSVVKTKVTVVLTTPPCAGHEQTALRRTLHSSLASKEQGRNDNELTLLHVSSFILFKCYVLHLDFMRFAHQTDRNDLARKNGFNLEKQDAKNKKGGVKLIAKTLSFPFSWVFFGVCLPIPFAIVFEFAVVDGKVDVELLLQMCDVAGQLFQLLQSRSSVVSDALARWRDNISLFVDATSTLKEQFVSFL